ncbi:cyclase family protein [Amycolatopsis thermoflava]|uniref:cyclase family protein n=1 Tax=Amycolatopsis thermoflava TaxID=84480 RepID=UPI00380E416D
MTADVWTEHALRELFAEISNWGRWGAQDERGTLNLIDADVVREAVASVRAGVAVGCGSIDLAPPKLPLTAAQQGAPAARHAMIQIGNAEAPGTALTTDYVGVAPHGPGTTHLDALCHVSLDGRLYNGQPASVVGPDGARALTVGTAADGITTRGVLVDVPALRGAPYVDPDQPVTAAELDAALARQGSGMRPGDALVLFVGRQARRDAEGPGCERTDAGAHLAGLDIDCLRWLRAHDVALLVADSGSDALPRRVGNVNLPIHVGTLVFLGLPLVDNADLREVVRTARHFGRYEFLLTVAPLRIDGGTASPVNPVAVF